MELMSVNYCPLAQPMPSCFFVCLLLFLSCNVVKVLLFRHFELIVNCVFSELTTIVHSKLPCKECILYTYMMYFNTILTI